MGVIYLTTNNINGKQYIGVDSKNDPHYYGSGKIIRLALKKYSRRNFTKEILEENDDSKYLFEREQYWIDKYDAIESKNFYNLAEGGKGGAGTLHDEESKERHKIKSTNTLKKISEKRKGKTYEEIYGVEKAKKEKEKRRLAGLGKDYSNRNWWNKSRKGKKSGLIPWNKGKKGSQVAWNKGKKLSTKKYIITDPDNKKCEFIGRHSAEEYLRNMNKNLKLEQKINYSKLFKEKKVKGYTLEIVTLNFAKISKEP
jgi:hypothetical protein